MHAAPTRREVVAEFVDKNQNAQDDDKGQDGAKQIGKSRQHGGNNLRCQAATA